MRERAHGIDLIVQLSPFLLVIALSLILYCKNDEIDWLEKELARTKKVLQRNYNSQQQFTMIKDLHKFFEIHNQKIKDIGNRAATGVDCSVYKDKEIQKLETSLHETTLQLTASWSDVHALTEELLNKTKQMEEAKSELARKDKELEYYHKEMKKLTVEVTKTKKTKDDIKENCQRTTESLEKKLVQQNKEIDSLQDEVEEKLELNNKLMELLAKKESCEQMSKIILLLYEELKECKPDDKDKSWWDKFSEYAEYAKYSKIFANILCGAGVKFFCFI